MDSGNPIRWTFGSVFETVEREGLSRHQAAARFKVAVSTVIGWVNQLRATGSLAPAKMGGRRPKKLVGGYRDWLRPAGR